MTMKTFSDGEVLYSADLNGNFQHNLQMSRAILSLGLEESGIEEGVCVTVDLTKTDLNYGQRYVKLNSTVGLYGNAINLNDTMNSHNHNSSNGDSAGSGSYTRMYSSTAYTPKYLMLGSSILFLSQGWEIPEGVILLSSMALSKYTSLSGYYLGIGYTSDGGSSSHSHGTNTSVDGGNNIDRSKSAVSNEIENRVELTGYYNNSGNYDSTNDIIPINGYALQLISAVVPNNYIEVNLNSSYGLLRFAENSDDILTEGGVETHTHSVLSTMGDSGGGDAQKNPPDVANHMPLYKAVRIIKRIS